MKDITYNQSKDNNTSIKQVENGLDFILSHFNQNQLFSRKIMTKKLIYQEIGQKEVFSKEEAMKFFKESDFIDCRINAFPVLTEYQQGIHKSPDFIFIDLDLDKNKIKTERSLKLALSKTLKSINEICDGYPTVLWSGNGYHIYQPIDAFDLQDINIFNIFENPSEKFLRFAKKFLSNDKADNSNNPSFKSCLLRIPFSYNSKCLDRGEFMENSQVKIIQRWDGKRPSIKYLLRDFRRYLINLKFKETLDQRKKQNTYSKYNRGKNEIWWIEKLLQIPLENGRKRIIDLVLAPYLINIKKLSYDESYQIIKLWLDKCDTLKPLDSNFTYRIKYAIKSAINKRIPNMKLETLKEKYNNIYSEITKNHK